jgi:endonuclease III related protein
MSLSTAIAELRRANPQGPESILLGSPWERALSTLLGVATNGRWADPAACAAMSVGQWIEALAEVPRGPQKAGVVKLLAAWWLTEFGDDPAPVWSRGLEHYRSSLRAIRGIGPETADRLLLWAADLPVVPVDRGLTRVLVRHGWIDWPPDDEGTQSTLLTALGTEPAELRDGVVRLQHIGAEYCGRAPRCDECPLKDHLPAGGPLQADAC